MSFDTVPGCDKQDADGRTNSSTASRGRINRHGVLIVIMLLQGIDRAAVMRLQRLLLRRLGDVIRRGASVNFRHVTNSVGGGRSLPSYVHGTGPLPLVGSTIGQLLEQRAEETPDREAVVVCQQNARMTFQQLLQQVNKAHRPTGWAKK